MLGWFKKKFKKKESEVVTSEADLKIPVAPRTFGTEASESEPLPPPVDTTAVEPLEDVSEVPAEAQISVSKPDIEVTSKPVSEELYINDKTEETEAELSGREPTVFEDASLALTAGEDVFEKDEVSPLPATTETQGEPPEIAISSPTKEITGPDSDIASSIVDGEKVSEVPPELEESTPLNDRSDSEKESSPEADIKISIEDEPQTDLAVQPEPTLEIEPEVVSEDTKQPEPEPDQEQIQDPIQTDNTPKLYHEDDSQKIPVAPRIAPVDQAEDRPAASAKPLLARLSERLSRVRETFTYQLDTLFLGKKEIDAQLLDDLEEILITADLGVAITEEILDHARRKVKRDELSDPNSLKEILKEKLKTFIVDYQQDAELVMPAEGPFVIMVVGVNGVGKTTSIGKIAHKFLQSGQSVLLVAADTFRAAATSQLKIWGERNNVPVITKPEGSDPSSVVYDGIAHAKAKDFDVVLVDTAGRLHTQANLMEELKKIKRVMGKQLDGAPHEVMLVIDATTGQNGISQAKLFNETVALTGITLTKLDGTAKGGIVANICREIKTPIRFIGVGEQLEDLRDFDPDEFIDALFKSSVDTEG